jgi:hypothetical protein
MVLDSDSGMKRARMVVEPPANVDVDIDKKLSCESSEMTGKGLEPRSTSRSHICGRSLKMASEVPAIQTKIGFELASGITVTSSISRSGSYSQATHPPVILCTLAISINPIEPRNTDWSSSDSVRVWPSSQVHQAALQAGSSGVCEKNSYSVIAGIRFK